MAMVTELALGITVEAQLVIAENTICVGHWIIPFKPGTLTSLLSRWDGTLNRGLIWLTLHSIWSKLKDPGTPPKVHGSVIVGVD